jgi:hypothetical protein
MPIGASFNIITYAGPSPSLIFVQTATTANTSGYLTFLNNSSLNGNPAAHFLVTQNVDPVGSDGIINDHAVGVWYDASVGEWTIYNEDHSPISNGASFNIFNNTNAGTFVPLVVTSSNTFGDSTCSSTFANSDLVLFVTHVNSGYFTDVAAVWWDAGLNENCIFDGSGNNIPLGATLMITQPW